MILNRLRSEGAKTIFHTCGMKSSTLRFADYPIDVLHLDQGDGHNPRILGSGE